MPGTPVLHRYKRNVDNLMKVVIFDGIHEDTGGGYRFFDPESGKTFFQERVAFVGFDGQPLNPVDDMIDIDWSIYVDQKRHSWGEIMVMGKMDRPLIRTAEIVTAINSALEKYGEREEEPKDKDLKMFNLEA